jgi:hypothetical protein
MDSQLFFDLKISIVNMQHGASSTLRHGRAFWLGMMLVHVPREYEAL